MFFINILLVLNNVSTKLIDSINAKLTISLYLKDGYDKNSVEVIDMINDIKKFSRSIIVIYKTKDEVLEELRQKDPELVSILERANPLPDTIALSNIQLKEYENLNAIIENKLFVLVNEKNKWKDYFSNYTSQYEGINKVISILNILQIGLYVIIWIFIVSIAVIVYSIIGNFIYYYRDEIYITRLVGWSNSFIYGPFVFQGIIYNFLSFAISTIIFIMLLKNLNFIFSDVFSPDFISISFPIFLVQGIVFTSLGGLSWFFSSRKYISLEK
jgi:cell division transport system permease protein